MPRTTLQLQDDALSAAKAYGARHRLTLGEAVSEMVRKAAERPLALEERNGFRVLRLDRRSPRVTAAVIERLRDEVP